MSSHLLHDHTLVCTLKFVCQVPLRCMRAVNEQQVCEAERHGVWLEEHLTLWPIRYFHLVKQIGTQSGRMAYQSSQRWSAHVHNSSCKPSLHLCLCTCKRTFLLQS